MKKLRLLLACLLLSQFVLAQQVTIDNYAVNSAGQVQLEIQAEADKYYLLHARHEPGLTYESITSMTLGVDGTLVITEPGGAFNQPSYYITEHSIANPDDTDGDGIDDISEFNDMPSNAPLNYAEEIPFFDGSTSIDSPETFAALAVIEDVPWAPFLNGQQFVKFGILDRDTDEPKVYFINSENHFIHAGFWDAIDATVIGDDSSGEIVYNPNEILPNGVIGSYSFNFSFGDAKSFEETRRTFELLIANMPFLRNNMQHFIGNEGEAIYQTQYADDYAGSRIDVVLESEVFEDINFIPLNQAEGYGFLRHMTLDENPGSRDIVIYDALPNSLPRVGGIITSVVQTPLSHVNLRAIQDNVPNAYIKNPLDNPAISNLLDSYVYYKVEDDAYEIRPASLQEVNEWYEVLRPTETQTPERDLSYTEILPLDDITFYMSTAFGAKCTNVSTMRTFGFPEGTIPNGFGVPFYFYDEFMKFNNLYQYVENMMAEPGFTTDIQKRIDRLDDLRDIIRDAQMPQWMLDELQAMHESFPAGTSVRCRSSTNNEDLPGFSGAGLYTSKTQHPHEGHIQKSIKQVYASMWNFRAFEERDFYRVDHFEAAMGVLCHPNYQEEKSNGVGISIDPIYQTENTFYLNTQVGEALITNPEANTIPEELLLYKDSDQGYFLLRESNLVNSGELVMDEVYLDQMREYLQVIHDEFAILYNVVGAEGFGMDIEYKVTAQDQLIIKQARPWVSFWANVNADHDLGVEAIIEPRTSANLGANELVAVRIANQGLNDMSNFDVSLFVDGEFAEKISISETLSPFSSEEYQFTIAQDFSEIGDYDITAVVSDDMDGYAKNDTLNMALSKLYVVDAGITVDKVIVKCDEEVEIRANIFNYGETTVTSAIIQAVVNGVETEPVEFSSAIAYGNEDILPITLTENLQLTDNEITLNLLSVNSLRDPNFDNNSTSTVTDLVSDYDIVTLIINADDYPQETSWQVYDAVENEVVAFGSLTNGTNVYQEEICVNYGSCLTLSVFDSYGDGICCGYGNGDFSLLDSSGEIIYAHDGVFESETTSDVFCPNEEGCAITTEITTISTSQEFADDGVIYISADGFPPFQYSIDGGETFAPQPTFTNLTAGDYNIVIHDGLGICTYEETVTLDFFIPLGADEKEELSIGINIYPNPAREYLTIEIDQSRRSVDPIKIQVLDFTGKLVQTDFIARQESLTQKVISLKDCLPGAYIIQISNKAIQEQFMIVKSN